MGVDKASLVVGDERLVDRTARLLELVCAPVLEVGPGLSDLLSVREEHVGDGPLAALAAGADALLARGHAGPTLVVAVDLPALDEGVLRWLVEHPAPASVVPVVDGMPQTLCARYGVDALAAVPDLVRTGERSLRALLAAVPVHEAQVDEWGSVAARATFADVDTPADAARAGLDVPG
jgi:molybdopterin-guanine dinucleotide biosynthesis protein A